MVADPPLVCYGYVVGGPHRMPGVSAFYGPVRPPVVTSAGDNALHC